MTKGQRAMAVAMIYPEPKRGVHSQFKNLTGDFSKANLSYARTVLHHTPDAAPLVLSGALSLDMAYQNAQDFKRANEGQEEGMRRLRDSANINRRHMTKGQRAMLIAVLYPDPGEKLGRGKKSSLSKDFNLEFSGTRLSQARTVLRYAPDNAPVVLRSAWPSAAAWRRGWGRGGGIPTSWGMSVS